MDWGPRFGYCDNQRDHGHLMPRTSDAGCPIIHNAGCHNEDCPAQRAERAMSRSGPWLANLLGHLQQCGQNHPRGQGEMNAAVTPSRIFESQGQPLGFSHSGWWLYQLVFRKLSGPGAVATVCQPRLKNAGLTYLCSFPCISDTIGIFSPKVSTLTFCGLH